MVADRLRAEILAGRLPPGGKLPAERELASALGVNRLTLRASLARLEALGLISTRHGSGTVVTSWRESAGLDALAVLLTTLDANGQEWRDVVLSLMELRRVLAAEAVALAAERHAEGDLETLSAMAAEQASRTSEALAFARGDIAFLRAVVRAGRNVGMELLLNTFARFPDQHPELVELLYDDRARALDFYPAVIEVIRSRDADAARQAIRAVLEAVDAEWQSKHLTPKPKRGKR